jgi:response regulator RpfG family c-di-GMP phosphodiesterase
MTEGRGQNDRERRERLIKLLIVEDERNMREFLKDFFEKQNYEVYTVSNGEEALKLIRNLRPHLVFLDIGLPGMSGIDILARIKEMDNTIKVIMVTAVQDKQKIEEATRLGASDYVMKPFSFEYMEKVALGKVHTQLFEDLRREVEEKERLYKELEKKADELEKAYGKLAQTAVQALYALAKALEARDPYTHGHSESVTRYATWIGEKLRGKPGWEDDPRDTLKVLQNGGLLHDLGKIGIVDGILNKPGKLTEEEWAQVKEHPGKGANILETVEEFKEYALVARHHHERWDGTGYPNNLKGKEIPPGARILAVADAYDAMTSDRPYRKAVAPIEAAKELWRCKGTQFDPEAVDAFIIALRERGVLSEEDVEKIREGKE